MREDSYTKSAEEGSDSSKQEEQNQLIDGKGVKRNSKVMQTSLKNGALSAVGKFLQYKRASAPVGESLLKRLC